MFSGLVVRTFSAALLLICCLFLTGGRAARTPAAAWCSLGGLVYVEENAAAAQYQVFREDAEAFADFRVFWETLPAREPGIWTRTDFRSRADFTIGFTDIRANADFTVYETPYRSLAGCTRP